MAKKDLYTVEGDKIVRKEKILSVLVVLKVYLWLTTVIDTLVVNADTLK